MTKPNPFGGGPKKAAAKAAPTKAAPRNGKAATKGATAVADPEDEASQEPQTLSRAQSRDPFAQPSGGASDYKFSEFIGEALLVKPYEEDVIPTEVSAETPIIRADVIRLDNENERVDDMLIFQSALLRTFRKVMNGPNNWCIGRLERGQAKGGKSAPYIFVQVEEDVQEHALDVAKELNLDL